MARRAKKKTAIPESSGVLDGLSDEEYGADVPPSEVSIFDGMADDSYVMIWRRDDISKRLVYHGKLSPSEAVEEHILDKFGGGEYMLREKKRTAEGRMVFGRQRTLVFAGKYKNPADVVATPSASVAPAAPGVVTADGNVNMEDIKMAGVLSLLQMTQQAASAQATMQQQTMTMLMGVMEAQRQGMEAIVKAQSGARGEQESPIELVKTVLELTRGASSPKSDIKELMEGMQSILAFRDDLMPARSSGDTVMDSVPKMLDLVKEGFALKKLEAEGKQVARPAAPAPAGALAAPSTPTPTGGDVPMWERVLKAQGKRLVESAMAGRDPGVVAAAAVEFMPEGVRGVMTEFVLREDVLELLYAAVPEAKQFPNWMAAFLTAAREELVPADEGEGEPDGDSES